MRKVHEHTLIVYDNCTSRRGFSSSLYMNSCGVMIVCLSLSQSLFTLWRILRGLSETEPGCCLGDETLVSALELKSARGVFVVHFGAFHFATTLAP